MKLHKELLSFNTCLESLIGVHQIDDTFDKSENAWNTCPAKEKINHARHNVTQIELVYTQSTNQDGEDACNHFVLHNCSVFSRLRNVFKFLIGRMTEPPTTATVY